MGSSLLFYPWSICRILSRSALSALPWPAPPFGASATLSSPFSSLPSSSMLLPFVLTFRVGVAIHSCGRVAVLIVQQVVVREWGRLFRLLRGRALRGRGRGAWCWPLQGALLRALGAGWCASCTGVQQAGVLLLLCARLSPCRLLARGPRAPASRGRRAGCRVRAAWRLALVRSCLWAHAHHRCVCVCTSRVDALLMNDADSQVFIFGGSDFFLVLHFGGV